MRLFSAVRYTGRAAVSATGLLPRDDATDHRPFDATPPRARGAIGASGRVDAAALAPPARVVAATGGATDIDGAAAVAGAARHVAPRSATPRLRSIALMLPTLT